ncbi:hypothetical protein GCM10009741_11270 [Kribbella lupini]|uniref:Uncharacterized protein n=1 Tax=Kribbella lupini TaxID=291602 RepID=A0ABN2AAU4_9ACTN
MHVVLAIGEPTGQPATEVDRQRRLADSGSTRETQYGQVVASRLQQHRQPDQVLTATREVRQIRRQLLCYDSSRRRQHYRMVHNTSQRSIRRQDPPLHLTQLRPRINAQFVGQQVLRLLVQPQRISLPTGPVQREHQQLTRPLPQRMLDHDRCEHLRGLLRPAQVQIGRREVLDRGQPVLVKPLALPVREVTAYAGQRRTLPQLERGPQCVRPGLQPALLPSSSRQLDQAEELVQVERTRRDRQHVPTSDRLNDRARQRAPQPRHVRPDHPRRGPWRLVGPERREQLVRGRQGAVPEQQQTEDRPLLGSAEVDLGVTVPGPDRAEQLVPQLQLNQPPDTEGLNSNPSDR